MTECCGQLYRQIICVICDGNIASTLKETRTCIPIAKKTNIFVAIGNVIKVNLVIKAGLVRDFTLARLDYILALYLEEDVICCEWMHLTWMPSLGKFMMQIHDGEHVE